MRHDLWSGFLCVGMAVSSPAELDGHAVGGLAWRVGDEPVADQCLEAEVRSWGPSGGLFFLDQPAEPRPKIIIHFLDRVADRKVEVAIKLIQWLRNGQDPIVENDPGACADLAWIPVFRP
jgi:hypothetical protein